jgi:hypothetical protein
MRLGGGWNWLRVVSSVEDRALINGVEFPGSTSSGLVNLVS